MGDGPSAAALSNPPTTLADPTIMWDMSPAEMFFTIKYGRMDRMMPPWLNKLSDDEIWRAAAYAWSLHTSQTEATAGKDLYDLSCAECHGPTGAGDGPNATADLKSLADPADTMAYSQADWVTQWQAAHNDIGGDWNSDLQRQVLEYIRTFSYVPAWESSYRPGAGVISGVVSQGTADMTLTSGLTVTLDAYENFDQVASFTTDVGDDGSFSFANLAVGDQYVYLATVAADDDIRYSSPVITLTDTEPSATTDIIVYATTDEPVDLRVDRAHWIVDSQPGALIVGQILAFGIGGDRTYIGSTVNGVDVPVSVGLMIPAAAEQVTFENGTVGDRFRQAGNIYYDTTPMLPGEGTKQIVVRYALPYDGTSIDITQDLLYPVTLLNLLVADLPDLQVDAGGLQTVGSQDFQGRTYQIWSGSDLPVGDIRLSLTGLLAAGDVDPREVGTTTDAQGAPVTVSAFEGWMAWASGALVLVIVAGVVGWAWRNGRLDTANRAEDLKRRQQELIAQIAHLDDMHALDAITPEAWATQRAQLKAKLLDLAARQPTRSA